MSSDRETESDEEFEVVSVTDSAWIHNIIKDVSKASVAKQMAVGGVTGWCTGYLFKKVGKAAALGLGGSLLIMQVANHKGYITINWAKLQRNMNKAKQKIGTNTEKIIPKVILEVREFIQDNTFIAGGFAGGFLLGIAI